jgi:hypothetical protein
MSETNANNIIISILDNGKGCYSLSLDRLLRLFYKTTRPLELLLAIPQSVQTQKVVINTLVYLVYGYYNSSTMKEVD